MKWVSRAIFSAGSRQEVNSTWYSEIEEPIKSREKHYSLVLYILISHTALDAYFARQFFLFPFFFFLFLSVVY